MSFNQAVNGTIPDSPHILAATNVRRGMTPAVWDATNAPHIAGVWMAVTDGSGPANCDGQMAGEFENGPSRWEPT